MFLVHINDLPEVVSGSISMFADDTKLYSTVSTMQDKAVLQADLDALAQWSDTWQLPFNANKCKVLHCTWDVLTRAMSTQCTVTR